MDPFLGEIKIFAGTYAPLNYAFCDGRTLAIAQHNSLYQLLGTKYGGDGTTNFKLPDLRARTPIGAGESIERTRYVCGEAGGAQHVPLGADHVPRHNHKVQGILESAVATEPHHRGLAEQICYAGALNLVAMSNHAIAYPGNDAHYNIQPCMGINFIIAMTGTPPQRS